MESDIAFGEVCSQQCIELSQKFNHNETVKCSTHKVCRYRNPGADRDGGVRTKGARSAPKFYSNHAHSSLNHGHFYIIPKRVCKLVLARARIMLLDDS